MNRFLPNSDFKVGETLMFISSDTNIWIDFTLIDAVQLPFRLPHSFYMSTDAIDAELIQPRGLAQRLVEYGLIPTEITEEEFQYAIKTMEEVPKLSMYDCFALAIAKYRNYILLTGDGRLRKQASKENVEVHGTLWIFDTLYTSQLIGKEEYRCYLNQLLHRTMTKTGIRLPVAEIRKRIDAL